MQDHQDVVKVPRPESDGDAKGRAIAGPSSPAGSESAPPAGAGTLKSQLAEVVLWEDWREYLDVVSWLVPDVYRHARAKVVGLVLLSVIGVAARAATIGSVLLYVNAHTTGEPLLFAGVTLPTDATLPVLLLWGGVAVVLAAVTIAASYRVNVVTFDLAHSYMEIAIRRVLHHQAAGRPLDFPEYIDSRGADPIALMLRGDTFRLVRVVVQTLGLLLPFVTLLVAGSVLLYTHWLLTLMLVPAMGGYTYALGLLNRGVLRDAQKREVARRYNFHEVKAMLQTLDGTRFPTGGEPEWLGSYPNLSWIQEVMGAYRGIILAKRRVAYLADAFQGVALLMVLMVFGSLVADQATSWAVLLTYLVALGYATRSMGGVSAGVTAANRYIPQVRRYVLFMQTNPESVPVPRDFDRSGVFRLEAREPRIPESWEDLEIRPGQIVWCVTPAPLTTEALGEVYYAMAGGDPLEAWHIESETFFLGRVSRLPDRPLRSYLPPPARDDVGIEKRVGDFLEAVGVRDEFDTKLGGLDTVLTRDLDEDLSPALRYALRLLPGALANPHLIVLNLEALQKLGRARCSQMLAALSDRVVVVVSGHQRYPKIPGLIGVFVIAGARIRGMGSKRWYRAFDWAGFEKKLSGESESGFSVADDSNEFDEVDEDD